MLIDIRIAEWEQACCGEEIKVGEQRSFTVHAAGPELTPSDPESGYRRPCFIEERHGLTPSEVPKTTVTGVVREIRGVDYQQVPVAGHPRLTRADDERQSQATELDEVGVKRSSRFDGYLVTVKIPDDSELPSRKGETSNQYRLSSSSAYTCDHEAIHRSNLVLFPVSAFGRDLGNHGLARRNSSDWGS